MPPAGGGRRLNGNSDLLRHLAGEERAEVELQPSFPLERLAERDNFLSLLYYFGLLSIRGAGGAMTVLDIPTRRCGGCCTASCATPTGTWVCSRWMLHRLLPLLRRMATDGAWEPVFDLVAGRIAEYTGIRDYIAGEKVLQGVLAAYQSLGEQLVLRSEAEYGKGYADLTLEPEVVRFPETRYGYLIELKYLQRRESADAARVEALRREAAAQIRRYLSDGRLARRYPSVRFIGVVLVFRGWELVVHEAAA